MKKINYGRQSINDDDIEAVINVLKSELLTQGPQVDKFEKELSKKFNTKYVCVVSSGTAALHLAGLALGWKKNDIILTTPLTFVASINAILYCNATPDLVDINMDTFCIDIIQLEKKIKAYLSRGKNIKAVIAVDYAGHPCDWKGLRKLKKKYNFQLINDNCHAIGASYNKNKGYGSKFADIVTHSYHPVKNITTAEGGAILTNNKSIYEEVKLLRSHGINRKSLKLKTKETWNYEIKNIGYNYRLSDLQSALGISQLKRLNKFVTLKNKIAKFYDRNLRNSKAIILPREKKEIKHAYHLYPVRIKFDKIKVNKSELFFKMKKKGINLQVHYVPLYKHKYLKEKFKFKEKDFPNTSLFYKEAVSLPIYANLSIADQKYVIQSLQEIVKL
jgi:UDP-4-amino-4,6-dideoxy-N-acetyl-beta-L-altrosamine transaminase